MGEKQDIVIIGAGIAGLATAYYLSRTGREVTIIEKNSGRNNCSYGNAGMIVPSHIIPLATPGIISRGLRWMMKSESPFYIKPRLDLDLLKWGLTFRRSATKKHVEESGPVLRDLLLKNRELLTELEQAESMNFSYKKNGLFMLCKTQNGFNEEKEVAEKARNLGLPAEILSAEEIREKEPNIEMDIIGGVYFPKDAHLHPGMLMNQLKKTLLARGVKIRYNTEMTDFESGSDKLKGIIIDNAINVEANQVVICAGAYSSVLAKKLGYHLPMQAGKGYSITLKNQAKLPKICALLAEAKVSMTPMNGDIRFGGTMEIAGNDTSITPAKISALKKSVCHYFPEYTLKKLEEPEVWSGLRPCSPDGLPYVGKLKNYQNCYVSTGHSMMGMSLGLSTGQLISQLITDQQAPLNHKMINPNRFN